MRDEEKAKTVVTGKTKLDLGVRTKGFALRIIKLYSSLPKTAVAQVLGRQVLRSGTSIGAHYREARRAKSNADFISKIEGALQELDETAYWLELLIDAEVVKRERLNDLLKETEELIAIFVTMVKKVKGKRFKSNDAQLHPSSFIPHP